MELTIEHLFTSPSIRDLAILVNQFIEGKSNSSEQGEKDVSVKNGRWVICQQPRPEAKLRLFCFPYAGGGASAFKSWNEFFSDDIELCIFQMPGREERLGEKLITDMSQLVDVLVRRNNNLFRPPLCIFWT